MQIDFRAPGTWPSMNEHVTESLGLDLGKSVARVYQGVGHALVEVCVGLSKLYPLKKKIYYFKNMDPFFDAAITPLAREGYKILPLDLDILKSPDSWLAQIEREDLFVLYSADDPILARTYDLALFEDKLKDKNLFKIKVSHSKHFYHSDEVMKSHAQDKNRASIYFVSQGQAVAILGERGRVSSLAADQLFYEEPTNLQWFKASRSVDVKRVESFEQERVADSLPLFKIGENRVADRAVIYWPDLDGAALIDRLAMKLGIQLAPAGFETRLESTSLSRWGGVRTMDFLEGQGLTSEMIRGLVIIHHELLDTRGEFKNKLIEVRNSILKDQLGG